jgi:hypothetical protein
VLRAEWYWGSESCSITDNPFWTLGKTPLKLAFHVHRALQMVTVDIHKTSRIKMSPKSKKQTTKEL